MAEASRQESAKLIVTSSGLEPAQYLRFALRRAIRNARVRSTGFRAVFVLEAAGEVAEVAKLVWRECPQCIGHLTAVLATVESRLEPIKEAAVRIAGEQIGPDETFCFRLRKRGAHGLEQDTSSLEQEIGGAIWKALEEKYGKMPTVNLKDPAIKVIAEILGPEAAVGIWRRAWREENHVDG